MVNISQKEEWYKNKKLSPFQILSKQYSLYYQSFDVFFNVLVLLEILFPWKFSYTEYHFKNKT